MNYLKSGREAIRLLYVLIIGLGITNAITDLFIANKSFVVPSVEKSVLFIIYFSFILRFFFGAYRVLAYDIDIEIRRTKVIINMFGFFIQAISFFIYSISYQNIAVSQWLVIIICGIDLIWILSLIFIYKTADRTSYQWLFHDLIIIIVLPINLLFWQNIWVLFIIAIVALILDLAINHEFYFSTKKGIGLKIFIYSFNTHNGVEESLTDLMEIVLTKGHHPIVSHKFTNLYDDEKLLSCIDLELLRICDAVYLLDRHGEENLIKFIHNYEIEIFSHVDEIPVILFDEPRLL
ncbi:MAG: hypothetical protein HND52_15065 [Ignavibacteriae bacterium]|nr:hypothetical protein [Ignavibacteriota bacterium]NOG99275.1 hypothetical protein [Ignavibacteriota bacterium]